MKWFLITLCVAYAAADVSHVLAAQSQGQGPEADAKIIKQELDVGPDGSYQWAFDTDNGISQQASGSLKDAESENPAQQVQGSAQWNSPEGEHIDLIYTADENGYQPQGSHLPTPPPIPEAILRALRYIQEHPPPTEVAQRK